MQSAASIEIARPIAEVFAYTLNKVPEWSSTVVEDEVVEDQNNGGVGTTFRAVTEDRGRRMEFAGTVTRHEPPRHSAIRLVGEHFDLEIEYDFEDRGGSTLVAQRSRAKGKGAMKLLFLIITPIAWLTGMGKKMTLKDLRRLKDKLEAGASA